MFIEKFLQYIKYEKAYSSHTFVSYRCDMSQFAAFVEQQKGGFSPPEITANDIRAWVLSMMEQGVGARSVNRKLTTLRTFFHYMKKEGIVQNDPMLKVRPPKMEKRLPVFLREEQMDELLDDGTEAQFPETLEGKRDKLIIELFYNLGVRLSELINMRDADFDFDRKTVRVTGKRNKQRYIPFGNSLKSDILAYTNDRDTEIGKGEGWLLVRKTGEKLYPMLVRRVVEKYISSVSTLSKRSPHVLRHTFATAMLNNGADIDAVKELLGHANLAATEVYTHTTFERLRNIYKQAHPRA